MKQYMRETNKPKQAYRSAGTAEDYPIHITQTQIPHEGSYYPKQTDDKTRHKIIIHKDGEKKCVGTFRFDFSSRISVRLHQRLATKQIPCSKFRKFRELYEIL